MTNSLQSYPDRIPIIVHYDNISFCHNGVSTPDTKCRKLLALKTIDVGKLASIIRCNIKISHIESIGIYINGQLVPHDENLEKIYIRYKSPIDQCLHVHAKKELGAYASL